MSNILIVEDDTALRCGIQELLQESAYSVWTAENYQQAQKIRAATESSGKIFDLYILDIMLENGSGYTLCQEIRKTEDTPIIFLSALDDEDHIIQGLNLGADDYISKPFHRRELLARVAAHIRRGRQQFRIKNSEQQNKEDLIFRSGDIVFKIGKERIYIQKKRNPAPEAGNRIIKIFFRE